MKNVKKIAVSCLALFTFGCNDNFGFGLLQPPEIDDVEPASGPTKGGTQVTVTGEHFIENVEILFEGKKCTGIKIKSEQELTCYVPANKPGEAKVKGNHEQTGEGSRFGKFTYEAPPKFGLEPGDEVGFSVMNISHCETDFCTPAEETQVAWRSLWIIEEGTNDNPSVFLSEETGEWMVKAYYNMQVNSVHDGAGDPSALFQDTWLADFGPYDRAEGSVDEGVGTFSTSVPPIPGAGPDSFPFFDIQNNWEVADAAFRAHIKAIDPDANFENQKASRRLEAYYIDSSVSPAQAHHVWIIFHSVGIVCSVDEEVTEAPANPSRDQSDFTGVLIFPKCNVSFPYVTRVGGSKQFCNCASDEGCE